MLIVSAKTCTLKLPSRFQITFPEGFRWKCFELLHLPISFFLTWSSTQYFAKKTNCGAPTAQRSLLSCYFLSLWDTNFIRSTLLKFPQPTIFPSNRATV